MPRGRPSSGIDLYKDKILELHAQKWKSQDIINWLADNQDLRVEIRTLRRRLQQWNTSRVLTEDTPELRTRIHFLYCSIGASDDEMYERLKNDGFRVTPCGLVRIRKAMGLKRLEPSREAREYMDEVVVRRLLEQELEKNAIQGYGRRQLVEHFKKLGYPVVRDRLFAQYRTLIPDLVNRRHRDLQS